MLFSLCSAMEWNHLPLAGGLYDQNPKLIDQFRVLFHEVNEARKRKDDKRKRESGKKRN